jgi:hypothetical protein
MRPTHRKTLQRHRLVRNHPSVPQRTFDNLTQNSSTDRETLVEAALVHPFHSWQDHGILLWSRSNETSHKERKLCCRLQAMPR